MFSKLYILLPIKYMQRSKFMKFTKLSLVAAIAASTLSTTAIASELEVSANVGVTNNYVWRGMTQDFDKAAVQGGIDLGFGGFYLGTWTSNAWDDTEVDGYAGYAGEAAGIEYDIGAIRYGYLDTPSANFSEAYLGLSKDFGAMSVGATYSMGIGEWDDGTDVQDDIAVDVSIPVMQDYSLDVGYGDYIDVGSRYYAGISKSFDKVDFSIAYHNFSHDTTSALDEKHVVVSASTGF